VKEKDKERGCEKGKIGENNLCQNRLPDVRPHLDAGQVPGEERLEEHTLVPRVEHGLRARVEALGARGGHEDFFIWVQGLLVVAGVVAGERRGEDGETGL
jgi:hypothetical protein